MSTFCVNTSSSEFKSALDKSGLNAGTLAGIVSEYQSNPNLWEDGHPEFPSDEYIRRYFIRSHWATPEEARVWRTMYSQPRIAGTFEEAQNLKREAEKYFSPEDVQVYKLNNGLWVMRVSRPIERRQEKSSKERLADLQRVVDSLVNNGALYRGSIRKNANANKKLGELEDNFERRWGTPVKAHWNKALGKYEVYYVSQPSDSPDVRPFNWNEQQQDAIDAVSKHINDVLAGKSDQPFFTIQGKAGTGKTTIINAILDKVHGSPNVLVGALSHKAKGVLDSKISEKNKSRFHVVAKSIAGMLGMKMVSKVINGKLYDNIFEQDKYAQMLGGIPIQNANIVFIDEASMVNEEQLQMIKDNLNPHTAVIFIGDQGQLPPIRNDISEYYKTHKVPQTADSPVFTDTTIPKVILTNRVRQGEGSPVLAFADNYWNYGTGATMQYPVGMGRTSTDNRLTIEGTQADFTKQLLPLFEQARAESNPNLVKIVAYRNETVDRYNREIHFLLNPEARAKGDMNFLPGDLVTFRDTYNVGREPIAYNSEEGAVVSTRDAGTDAYGIKLNSVTLRMASGKTIDAVVLEQSPSNLQKFNNQLNVLKSAALADRKQWRAYYALKEEVANLQMSYAITSHKSQGSTYDVVAVDAQDIESVGPISSKEKSQSIYTALTRASNISIMRVGTSQEVSNADFQAINNKLRDENKFKGRVGYVRPFEKNQIAEDATKLAKAVSNATMAVRSDRLDEVLKEGSYTLSKDNFKKGDVLTIGEVAAIIADKSVSPMYKALAKALIPIIGNSKNSIKFETENSGLFPRHQAGTTDGNTGNIIINLDSRSASTDIEKTLLHEMIHTLTVTKLRQNKAAWNAMQQIIDYTLDTIAEDSSKFHDSWYITEDGRRTKIPIDVYGLFNPKEFVAEFFANKEFQDMLKEIPAKDNQHKSIFEKIIDWIARLFNIATGTTLYDQIAPYMAYLVTADDAGTSQFSTESYSPDVIARAKALLTAINKSVKEVSPKNIEPVTVNTDGSVVSAPLAEEKRASKKEYQIKRIVSGGQTGMDQIGLQVAKSLGIRTGGIAPRGFMTEEGNNPSLQSEYGLTEDTGVSDAASNADKYVSRTEQNASQADGTVYFAVDAETSRGIHATRRGASQGKKVGYMLVLEAKDTLDKPAAIDKLIGYLKRNNITTLNVAGSRMSAINAVAEKYPALAEDFADILRGAIEQLEEVEKPEATFTPVNYFNLQQEANTDSRYTSTYRISDTDAQASNEQKVNHIERLIANGQLPIASLILADGLSEKSKKLLDGMQRQGIYKTRDGNYTVGLREDEIRRIDEFNNLLGKPLFGTTELRHLAKMAVFKLSENITLLQSNPDAARVLLGDDYAGRDFTSMSRIEIINEVGLGTLLERTVKEPIFNTSKNTEPADNDDTIAEKMDAIYENFDAFIRLGYDSLIGMEEVSFSDRAEDVQSDRNGVNAEDGTIDDTTEQEAQAIYGSAAEHWQVGFRQVSAFSSLSQMIKRSLDKLYQLNADGTQVINDFGLAESIDSSEAVAKILHWTQYAESLDDKNSDGTYSKTSMVGMLQQHLQSEPWLQQLVSSYHPGGNMDAAEVLGELIKPDNSAFKSQFFSNFKKYFQKYTITYKDNKGRTLMKTINDDTYTDSVLREIEDRVASKDMGNLTIWDADKKALDVTSMTRLDTIWNAINEARVFGDEQVKLIAEAYKILNIETPELVELRALFEPANNPNGIKNFLRSLRYLTRTLQTKVNTVSADKFNPVDSSIARSDYKSIIGLLSPAMGDNTEAVSYEAGKLYYGYVTPSYLNKLIGKLQGHTENYDEFIQREYKQYEGMFYNTTDPDAEGRAVSGPKGWMNYWLERLNAPGEQGKKYRKMLEHVASLSYNKIGYSDKTPAQYMASMVSMFLYDDNAVSAYYRIPTMSNKPSEEYIRFERLHVGYRDTISKYLAEHTFYQELNRIRAVNERNATLPKDRLIKNFDKNGSKFHFMDYLNDYIDAYNSGNEENPKYELGRLISKLIRGEEFSPAKEYTDGTVGEASYFKKALEQAVKDSMDEKFEKFLEDCTREGFITRDSKGEITDVFEIGDKVGKDPVTARNRLEEFFWNDTFAAINILQLTVTDIAYYKDTEDLQKRLAQLHAPGMRGNQNATDLNGNKVTDGKERTMYLADCEIKSDILSNLKLVHQRILESDRFKNNPAAKAAMKKQLDSIIDDFKKVNFADAQGYSSPTSYRKKMTIFGKWDQHQEDAYKRILSGDFSDRDLSVAWQPLKPFVYTQIEKNSHSSFMPKLKVGVQNKNSEYLLIIADALMRSQGINSKLSAIYDAMEESQGLTKDANGHWTGTPNTRGIDTVQFESTVKAGLTGVLNINNLSKKEITDLFRAKMYNQDGSYNTDYVHELPFEDYSIQQEVPAHFKGKQGHGSQDRILTITDMPNTDAKGHINYVTILSENNSGNRVRETISVEEAKKRYYKAITDNIHDSMDEVIRRFNLDNANPKLRNIALSRMLQQEIIKDARYGTDLLWACSVDKNGEFNIPLSDPIQSGRIQQLLNSIIKNNINKQEIAGGPVVQVSNYGTSEDLVIRFQDKDGNVLMSEAEFNRAKNGEIIEGDFIKPDTDTYEQYRDKHQNSVAYFECYVPIYDDNIVKDFGRPDGTIDIAAMEKENPRLLEMIGYRIPTESKYSMVPIKIKGFLPRNAGEGIMLPKEITTLSGSDFDIDKLYIMRYNFHRVEYRDKRSFAKNISEQTGISKSYIYSLVEGKLSPEESLGETTNKRILDAWKNYNVTKASYRSWEHGRFANDNYIIATQWAILTSLQVQEQLFTPGNFNEPKRVGYMIAAMDNTGKSYDELKDLDVDALKKECYTKKSLLYANTQMQFHKQNMVAAKLIGVFAQSNVSHGFMSLPGDATLEVANEGGFTVNGHTIKGIVPIDREFGFDGVTRISNSLAAFLAASVDAVKDPILNLMNINMTTVNVASAMTRLGFTTETIGWFLTHPAIVDLIKTYNMENTHGRKSIEDVISDKLEELQQKYNTASNPDFDFTDEFFIENHKRLGADATDEQKQEQANNDYNVLLLYNKINELAKAFRLIIHMTRYNSISSAVGPFAANTMVMKIQDREFESSPYVTDSVMKAANNPILRAFRSSSYALESQLLGNNIIQASPVFEKAFEKLYNKLGYMNNNVADKFSNFFMSYYVNLDNPVFDLSYENRSYMIDKFPLDFLKYKDKYPDNLFIKSIKLNEDRAGNKILELKTRGMQSEQIQDIRNSCADLFNEDPQLAVRLVEYNFFRGSFGFSPQTFMSLVPNQVKVGLKNYVANLSRRRELTEDEIDNLLTQFMLNTGITNLGKHEFSELHVLNEDEETGKYIIQKDDFSKSSSDVSGISLLTMEDGSLQYVTVEPNPSDRRNSVIVTKVNKLGGNNQGFEIDPTVKVPKSVWQDAVEEEDTTSEDTESEVEQAKEEKPSYYSQMLNQLFRKDGELDALLDGTAEDQIKTVTEKLQEYTDNSMAFPMIPDAVANKVRQIISDVDLANLTAQKAEQTIKELNLCQ